MKSSEHSIFNLKALYFSLILVTLFSCAKKEEKSDYKTLQGTWTLKSQVDSFPLSGPTLYRKFDHVQQLEFKSDGKVYSKGIVTPTWFLQPYMGSASYKLDNKVIRIGDSIINNSTVTYLTPTEAFRIVSIQTKLLVLQHLNKNAIYTIDSLEK